MVHKVLQVTIAEKTTGPVDPEQPGELLTAPTPKAYGQDVFGNYKLEFGYNDMDYFGNEDMKFW
mgnify:CR=1 FL=1